MVSKINDSDHPVKCTERWVDDGGIRHSKTTTVCKYYAKWKDMMTRCYGTPNKKPIYLSTEVCREWHTFSNFKDWCVSTCAAIEGHDLDKDLLGDGTIYSPDTCAFILHKVNLFITDTRTDNQLKLTGVTYRPACKEKYEARCSDPFGRYRRELGRYSTPELAHESWRQAKHKYACELADSEYVTDERVAEGLRNRYKPS